MKRDEASGVFRGSVYVEFEHEASASRAVANPPMQLGSSSQRLHVMFKSDYQQQKRAAADRRPDHMHGSKRHKLDVPSMASPAPPPPPPADGLGGNSSGPGSTAYWQHLAEEREKRVRELEQQLKQEKDHSAAMMNRLTQVCASTFILLSWG